MIALHVAHVLTNVRLKRYQKVIFMLLTLMCAQIVALARMCVLQKQSTLLKSKKIMGNLFPVKHKSLNNFCSGFFC